MDWESLLLVEINAEDNIFRSKCKKFQIQFWLTQLIFITVDPSGNDLAVWRNESITTTLLLFYSANTSIRIVAARFLLKSWKVLWYVWPNGIGTKVGHGWMWESIMWNDSAQCKSNGKKHFHQPFNHLHVKVAHSFSHQRCLSWNISHLLKLHKSAIYWKVMTQHWSGNMPEGLVENNPLLYNC